MRKSVLIAGAALSAALLVAGSASSAVSITNGGFETNGGNGQVGVGSSIGGWTVSAPPGSYVFVWNPQSGTSGTSADHLPGDSAYQGSGQSNNPVALWGPDDGAPSSNHMTLSPNGGAFIGEDPAYDNSSPAITQTITGLTVGQVYDISFYWAAAQQYGYTGGTTEWWTVDLGSSTAQSTAHYSLPSEGFSGWMLANMDFTATSTSETLSFISGGTSNASLPPFALLDGVTITAVPEPAAWALMLVGIGALGAGLRTRRRELLATA